jgi:hypothetical protein
MPYLFLPAVMKGMRENDIQDRTVKPNAATQREDLFMSI